MNNHKKDHHNIHTSTQASKNFEQRGDQMPEMTYYDDEYAEVPPIFFHLDDYRRHPLQHTRSTRIPLYHINHVTRG